MNKFKILSVVFLMTVTAGAAIGQASVSLGLKGGLNFANINASTPGAVYNSKTGYHAGAFVKIKLTKLAIVPELLYSSQGSDVTSATTPGSLALSYISIPVMLKFYLISGLNIQAGPQFGFLTSATFAGTDVKSAMKSSDTSISLGAGFDISKFVIDARYNIGISEVNEQTAPGSSAGKNQVIQLSVGYKLFDFGN